MSPPGARWAVSAVVVLVTACSGHPSATQSTDRRPASTATTWPPTSTTTTTVAFVDGHPVALPRCDPGEIQYVTEPDWYLDLAPSGLVVTADSTTVRTDPGDTGSPVARFELAERTRSGHLLHALELERDTPMPLEYAGDYYAAGPTRITTVRGQPGQVVHVLWRGNAVGLEDASWFEDGHAWEATSVTMTDRQLAAALAPLRISSAGVTDPSGRLIMTGAAPPVTGVHTDRTTDITLSPPGATDTGHDLRLTITSKTPGEIGLTELPDGRADAALTAADGRWVATAGPRAVTTLADGSLAWINKDAPADVDPSRAPLMLDEARNVFNHIVAAPPTGQRSTVAQLLEPTSFDPTDTYCREQ